MLAIFGHHHFNPFCTHSIQLDRSRSSFTFCAKIIGSIPTVLNMAETCQTIQDSGCRMWKRSVRQDEGGSPMSAWQVKWYREIFQSISFRRFWLGFTFSAIGDAMTKVAFIWFVYQSTGSAQAVGWLLLCYTGPVVLGGLFAGSLLDRFDRRMVMLIDNTFRGAVVALIPLLYYSGHLALW